MYKLCALLLGTLVCAKKRENVILVSYDGFRHDYLDVS